MVVMPLISDPVYTVASIPKELLQNAKAVIRLSETVFEIEDIGRATSKIKLVVTVLNQNGIEQSVFMEPYNKFISVRNFSWELYDKDGNKVKKDSKALLTDFSAISGYSLYEDLRVKYLNPNYRNTPFTISLEYELELDGLLSYPPLVLYPDYNVSVENMLYTVICPGNMKLRYHEENMTDPCKHTVIKNKDNYNWVLRNKPALRQEPFSPPPDHVIPLVMFAPSDFEIDGYKGNSESWKNFGVWITTINKERDKLPEEKESEILKLVAGKTSDVEKIRILYSYLQEKVRYVNISVGIGGWQTINAETVHRLSYGDCKALSNYMHTLLDIAGIKNYYALVKAGRNEADIFTGFPSNTFNHMIVCVPQPSDTIWLECTSQHLPCGFIGKFTDNRHALLIGNDGGVLVKTREYVMSDNSRSRNIKVDLSENGNGNAVVETIYCGIFYDDINGLLHIDNATRDKRILSKIPIKSFNISNISFSEIRDMNPSVIEKYYLDMTAYGTLTGERMIFKPDLISRLDSMPSRLSERRSPVYLDRPYITSDTIMYSLPGSFRPEQLPEDRSVETRFGSYSSTCSVKGSKLIYTRTIKMKAGTYPASDYSDFINFCEKISVLDERKVILTKSPK